MLHVYVYPEPADADLRMDTVTTLVHILGAIAFLGALGLFYLGIVPDTLLESLFGRQAALKALGIGVLLFAVSLLLLSDL